MMGLGGAGLGGGVGRRTLGDGRSVVGPESEGFLRFPSFQVGCRVVALLVVAQSGQCLRDRGRAEGLVGYVWSRARKE